MINSTKASKEKLLGIPTNEGTENASTKISKSSYGVFFFSFYDDLFNDLDISRSYDDETESVAYNYSLFHLMLFFASFYIMVTLTK